MENEPDRAADDPEIAALLNFTPVPRRVERTDGWGPDEQRRYIASLAATGSSLAAARAVRRSESGAKQLRRESDAFRAAWAGALALYRARQAPADPPPPPPVHAPPPHAPNRHARRAQQARARQAGGHGDAPELEEAEKRELLDEILQRYLVKLQAERTARLEGRIVEADFYVRQLTFIELALDVGGRTQELLHALSWDGLHLLQVSATPGSVLLEKARRTFWLEKGEADRPPPAPLGRYNERFATGRDDYDPARDGDRKAWEQQQAEKRRLAAAAQAEWEARARREAGPDNDNDVPDPAA